MTLADTAWVFDLTTDDGYDHNYQVDGGLETYASGSGTTVANVFTVPEKENGVSETLKAVSLSLTHAAGVTYTIDVYTDIRNKYNPTSGTKHESASTSGSTTYAGVYTIPLNEDVELKPGTTFSVVVTLDRAVMDCEQATAIQKEEDFGTDKYVWMRQVSMYNYKSFLSVRLRIHTEYSELLYQGIYIGWHQNRRKQRKSQRIYTDTGWFDRCEFLYGSFQ